ncbi:MAG TPA: S8 family serine peptidase [Bryobacteraceae bacterium]|nr:S8 family serine peptidase [Bryobacteraceae bacterium]
MRRYCVALVLTFAWLGSLYAAELPTFSGRYALILDNPSAAEFAQVHHGTTQAIESHRQQIRASQDALRSELTRRKYIVTGAVQTLLNAVFVIATPQQMAELRSLPGVRAVRPLRRFHPNLARAVVVIDANPNGWNLAGGEGNAGKGLKIGMIDTGIDQTHPAFQDASLPMPAGFPKCDVQSNCANFTNNKVIVARSYVKQLAAGTAPNPAATSRPDDYSARDRDGHGTATAMCAAGESNPGPAATIAGVAPKAYLGNYKVFGDPEVNGFTGGDIIVMALEDALNDGMDIVSLSLGSTALSGPLDTGAACGASAGAPCDPEAFAVENAIQSGMLVIAAAGNEGENGSQTSFPTQNTIDSPGDAPSAIAVAGNFNGHTWGSAVLVSGGPSAIQNIQAQASLDGPQPGKTSAPLFDVTPISGDPLGCNEIPGGSLAGDLVLIERGTCDFSTKVFNAQSAGAVGVIVYDPGSDNLLVPSGLFGTSIPMALIGETDGTALKTFIDANPGHTATLELVAQAQQYNIMAAFSSRGPTINGMLKPDVTAVGTDLYMATQRFNPDGDLYGPDGFTISQGTSFSTPQVAGATALVKQVHPNYTPAQMKSAVVNTAVGNVLTEDGSTPAFLISQGAGLLDVAAAISTTVAVAPTNVSFGYLTSFPPANVPLQITNTGSSSVNLTLAVAPLTSDANAKVNLSSTSVSLSAGQSTTVTATLRGTMPVAGSYEGFITIKGGAKELQVPYLYVVGDGVPFNVTATFSVSPFDCTVGQVVPDGALAFQLIDQWGVPVSGIPIIWTVNTGGGSISSDPNQTDSTTEAAPGVPGFGFASAACGPTPGPQEFMATVGGMQVLFDGTARLNPTISPNSAVNAASFQVGQGVAPGSYIALFGTGLSDTTDVFTTPYLPLAIDSVSVSFDVPSANLSLPGLISYVSPGQVNLQVPWELQGQSSAVIKVTIQDSQGTVYTLPLAAYSPAFFDELESGSNTPVIVALDASGNRIGSSHPATRGQVVQLYANGLGPVNNQPTDGELTPMSPQSTTTTNPTVTIGGQPATVQFSGLAPNLIGVYQLTVTVPANISAGLQSAIVTINGVASPAANLPVQ